MQPNAKCKPEARFIVWETTGAYVQTLLNTIYRMSVTAKLAKYASTLVRRAALGDTNFNKLGDAKTHKQKHEISYNTKASYDWVHSCRK